MSIGKVLEMWQPSYQGRIYVLIQHYTLGDEVMPYRALALQAQNDHRLYHIEMVECILHAFHNCAAQQCQITATREIRQERIELSIKGDEYCHNVNPDDLLLNLSQMRNASLIQHWQPLLPLRHLTVEEAAYNGVALQYQREEDEKRRKAAAQAAREAAKAKREGNRKDWRPKMILASESPLETQIARLTVQDLRDVLTEVGSLGNHKQKKKQELVNTVIGDERALEFISNEITLYRARLAAQEGEEMAFNVDSDSDEGHIMSVEDDEEMGDPELE